MAERNIRSFLRSAQFKGESDREAALNCVDVLWAAARDPADSVLDERSGIIAAQRMGAHSTQAQTADYIRNKKAIKSTATR